MLERNIQAVGTVEWAPDGAAIFYTVPGEDGRPSTVMRHTLGNKAETDDFIYHEPDPKAFIDISKTKVTISL